MMRAISGALLAAGALASPLVAQMPEVSFFVAGEGPSWGGDAPALQVSDQHCRDLAYGAGLGDGRWRAYLDGAPTEGEGDEVARERIGEGPWINYYGVTIAEDLEQLHSEENNLTTETAVTVSGEYAPETLEIPAGRQLDGSLFTREGPFLCFRLPG